MVESIKKKGMDRREGLKIHDCSELPKFARLTLDSDCLERIQSTFALKDFVGNGQYGLVFQVSKFDEKNSNEDLVVKVSEINEKELRIACSLNGLSNETPIFPHTYGWLICPTIPHRWGAAAGRKLRAHMFFLAPPEQFMFTFMQPVDVKWNNLSLTENHGYRVALFFLLHGLLMAKKRLGSFIHGDIHEKNVMLQPILSTQTSTLRYGHYEAELVCQYVPRLIDYGRSSMGGGGGGDGGSDLRQLKELFHRTLDPSQEEMTVEMSDVEHEERRAFFQFIASSRWNDDNEEITLLQLLEHDYFDVPEIRRSQVKRQAVDPIQFCFSCCASNPQFQVDLEIPKFFCGKRCYQKVTRIGQFIK